MWTPTRWNAIALLCGLVLSWVEHELRGGQAAVATVHGMPVQTDLAWIQFVVMLVASWLLSAAMGQKKPPPPTPEVAQVPRVEDGAVLPRVYGTVWIENPVQLAVRQMGPADPIKSKGGKK
jgi:hypothetical protein